MALTVTSVTPTPTNKTAGGNTTFAITNIGTTAAVNDTLVICIAADNAVAATLRQYPSIYAVDSKGNNYRPIRDASTNVGVGSGSATVIFESRITNAVVATDTLTLTSAANALAVAIVVWKIATDGTVRAQFMDSGGTTGGTGTTPTTTTPTLAIGDIIIGTIAVETNAVTTADADTSGGSWSAQNTAVANTGSVTTSQRVSSQYKIVTTAATQTYNPTLGSSADNILSWAWFKPQTIPTGPPVSYGCEKNVSVQRAAVI